MNKQAVIDILRKIFTFYGYSTSSPDISDLLAEKDSEHLFIKFEPSTNINSIRHFSDSVQRYGGKAIQISESFDEKVRSFALDEGLVLWDKNELESRVGRAVLAGALEERPEGRQVKREAGAQPSVHREIPKKEYDKTIRIFLRSVAVNIGKPDALSIGEAKAGKAKYQQLKFIPIWYYRYSFKAQKKFKSRMIDLTGDGEGYINALTGENSFNKYQDIQDNTLVPTQNYEIKQPKVEKKDALSRAVEAIVREHTKQVRINEMIGDTIVFENKVFSPEPQDIGIEMELIHIPVWEIRGKSEAVEINGYDGKIVAVKTCNDADFV
ncbi:MAG: hypothetical protein OIN66_09510 [Candidatus Methanoperedens sp.]|nr:hypothetical protein [Candidatus Methanoperedens sp.]